MKRNFLFCEIPKLYCTVTGLNYSCICLIIQKRAKKKQQKNNVIYPENIIWVSAFINIILVRLDGLDDTQYAPQF